MQNMLAPELYWILLTALLTSFFWTPHILQRIAEMGPHDAFRDPYHDKPTQAAWAQRAIRAHNNAVENLVVMALFAVSIQILNSSSPATAFAAKVYFFARIAHYFIYVTGVPWLRTPVFLAGFFCQMMLAGRVLGWL